uniref:hypothetical protein n=1 Tax=Anaplasma centrale TaxID=769 RepID=UPI0016512BD4|nr:hypothetical protein [Anaplasma centrale]
MLLKLRFLLIAGVFTWSILHGVPAGATSQGATGEADDAAGLKAAAGCAPALWQ